MDNFASRARGGGGEWTVHAGEEDEFRNRTDVRRAIIPSTASAVGDSAFENCTELREVEICDGVREIGSMAFRGCRKLECAKIPSTVTEIGSRAFEDCASLSTVELSPGLKKIGRGAFRRCRNLKRVAIPVTVRKIDEGAFEDCQGLVEVELYSRGCESMTFGELYFWPHCQRTEEGWWTEFNADAFLSCKSLEKVQLCEGIQFFSPTAFEGCRSFNRRINIPSPAFAFSHRNRIGTGSGGAGSARSEGDSEEDRNNGDAGRGGEGDDDGEDDGESSDIDGDDSDEDSRGSSDEDDDESSEEGHEMVHHQFRLLRDTTIDLDQPWPATSDDWRAAYFDTPGTYMIVSKCLKNMSAKGLAKMAANIQYLVDEDLCYDNGGCNWEAAYEIPAMVGHYGVSVEATSILELALWKTKIDETEMARGDSLRRKQCRRDCDAQTIIPLVLPYIHVPWKETGATGYKNDDVFPPAMR